MAFSPKLPFFVWYCTVLLIALLEHFNFHAKYRHPVLEDAERHLFSVLKGNAEPRIQFPSIECEPGILEISEVHYPSHQLHQIAVAIIVIPILQTEN